MERSSKATGKGAVGLGAWTEPVGVGVTENVWPLVRESGSVRRWGK